MGPTVVLSLINVTVVEGEPVEIQITLEDGDPRLNIRLLMLGIAVQRNVL